MSSSTVSVAGISSKTSEKEVRDFFSFCGKIKNISINESSGSKSAEVTFEKDSAAKTALLLDSTQLGDTQVHVTSASGVNPLEGKHDHDDHEISQEDKPRSRIMAEYLAHGYRLGDQVIQRGLAFDQTHGVSSRFTQALQNFDAKYDASGKAKSVDNKYAVSDKAAGAYDGLVSYFESALGTPTGQKLRAFYESGSKQVADVHNEALHLSGLAGKSSSGTFEPHSIGGSDRTACGCQAAEKKCGCAPGKCGCSTCNKNPDADTKATGNTPQKVSGTDRTTCNCGADTKNCPCAPGTCACANCAKNPDEKSSASGSGDSKVFSPQKIGNTERTACGCQSAEQKCGCAPGKCGCSTCKKNPDADTKASGNTPQKVSGTDRTTCNCGSDTKNCPCAPGTCACSNCAKNPDDKSSSSDSKTFSPQKIGNTERTACGCQSAEQKCGCAPGKCGCSTCTKNPDADTKATDNKPQKVAGTDRTTCNCGADTSNCPCAPGTCACSSCAKNPDTK